IPKDVTLSDGSTIVPFSGLHAPCANQISPAMQAQFAAAGQALSTPIAAGPGVPAGDVGSCAVDGNLSLANNPHYVPFNANTLPFVSPDATALLTAGGKYGGIFPQPTTTAVNGIGQFNGGNNSPTNLREEIVRIDHNFNSKFSVFGHYVAEQVNQNFGTTLW